MTEQLGMAVRKGQLHVQIQHDATHDRLTGLPNRTYFEAWSDKIVCDEIASVLMIDLDRFKEVNDTLGHHAGDNLLHQVATRLQECLADDDFPARFGGNEFAVLVPGAGEHEASLLAETISQALERPFELGGSTVAIAASIGITTAPAHGRNAASLLRRADLAMYDAKRRHNRSSVYQPSMDGNDSVRLAMLGDLRDALRNGGIEVDYQPKSDLRTGVVVGVEALARWVHPVHGAVSPEVFVPLAEQAGLIEELTEHMITRSLAAVARLRAARHRAQRVGESEPGQSRQRSASQGGGEGAQGGERAGSSPDPRDHGTIGDRRHATHHPDHRAARSHRCADLDRRLRYRPLVAHQPAATAHQ